MKYRVVIEIDTECDTTFAVENGSNAVRIIADFGNVVRANVVDTVDVSHPRNIDNLRAMDSYDLADFLESIKDGCYDLARYGAEACSGCALETACNYHDSLDEWLDASADVNNEE